MGESDDRKLGIERNPSRANRIALHATAVLQPPKSCRVCIRDWRIVPDRRGHHGHQHHFQANSIRVEIAVVSSTQNPERNNPAYPLTPRRFDLNRPNCSSSANHSVPNRWITLITFSHL